MKAKFKIKKEFLAWLKANRYRVSDLAKLLGYKESQISAILNGKIEPSMRFLHKLCSELGIGIGTVLETSFKK